MEAQEIFGLFGAVGTVQTAQSGSVLCFDAQIARGAIRRLYYRTAERLELLGLLLPENGALRLKGKRPLSLLSSEGVFTTTRRRWSPMRALDGGNVIPSAVETEMNGATCIAFAYTRNLPPQVLPYFCFLHVGEIDGEPCWYLFCDASRMPIFRELSP